MKKIIIDKNVWQTRIAIVQDNTLQNVYFSAHAQQTLERSFFKAVVTKILPGIQTAFVDIGQEKAGFLHISEVDRELAIAKMSGSFSLDEEAPPTKPTRTESPNIQKIFKEGEAILVQVSKEPIYEKGAKLSTCFTLPGRFIVLMPNIPRIGVSKKIESRQERQRLKDLVHSLLPEGMGAIIRTTSEDQPEKYISKDIRFLVETWDKIQKKFAAAQPTEKIYEDLELTLQVVRDNLDDDVEAVITNDKDNQQEIYTFIKTSAPEYTHKVSLYEGSASIFDHYGIEKQIEQTLSKRVELKSGGSLIIESTEAMTVIDVNTGKFIGKSNLEETILKTNLEAAQEVVRQLRLRNIGGLIVIDFIDMATPANRHKLFTYFGKTLREQDKFQSVVLKISEFGIVQMTRKRSGKTLLQELTDDCPTCAGLGYVKSLQTECYGILRAVKQQLLAQKQNKPVILMVNSEIFTYLTNIEYDSILQLEKAAKTKIEIESKKEFKINQYKIEKKQ